MLLPTYQYTLAANVFVPSVLGENIPTDEFGMIPAETACWDIEENSQIFTALPSSMAGRICHDVKETTTRISWWLLEKRRGIVKINHCSVSYIWSDPNIFGIVGGSRF